MGLSLRAELCLGALALAAQACSPDSPPATATPRPTTTAPPTPAPASPTAAQLPTVLVVPSERQIPDEGRNHIPEGEPGTYDHFPPSSGEHYAPVLQYDYYAVEVPPEYYVHNLEHGAIVVLYNCPEPCPDTETLLGEFFDRAPPDDVFGEVKVVIGQNSDLESKVVALAWGYQMDLPEADVEALLDFYRRHVNQGPELAP
jgi:hypothetical protein